MKVHFSVIFVFAFLMLTGETFAVPSKTGVKNNVAGKAAAPRSEKVKASSFGFNAEDATECLQKAINSGAKVLHIDNTGKDYIISKTIRLASDQKIILDENVVIRAKNGSFKSPPRPMFYIYNRKNVHIEGRKNSAIINNRKLYRNPKIYPQGEYRHIFLVIGSENLTFKNLTLKESGGDAIDLQGTDPKNPFNRNILIENVLFDGSMRLGLGIGSVENLIVRKCRFINADGTPPAGGIDIEPNKPFERLVNILVEDCVFENNTGSAFAYSPSKLNSTSLLDNCILRSCTFRNNGEDLYIHPYYKVDDKSKPARGSFLVDKCRFEGRVQFRECAESIDITFRDTLFRTHKKMKKHIFLFVTQTPHDFILGNVKFENCHIDNTFLTPSVFSFITNGKTRLSSNAFSGTLTEKKNGTVKKVDLAKITKDAVAYYDKFARYVPVPSPDIKKLALPDKNIPFAAPPAKNIVPFRGGEFLQYAEKGKETKIKVITYSNTYDSSIGIVVRDPAGKVIYRKAYVPGSQDVISFVPEKTGIYSVTAKSFNSVALIGEKGSAWKITRDRYALLQPNGRLYFTVPSGVTKFALGVDADPEERITIYNAKGEKVLQKTVGKLDILEVKRKAAEKDEIWSIEMWKASWSVNIRIYEPLAGLVSPDPALLLKVKK